MRAKGKFHKRASTFRWLFPLILRTRRAKLHLLSLARSLHTRCYTLLCGQSSIFHSPYLPRRFTFSNPQAATRSHFPVFPVSHFNPHDQGPPFRWQTAAKVSFFHRYGPKPRGVSREPKCKLFATTFHTFFSLFFTGFESRPISLVNRFSYILLEQLTTEPFTDVKITFTRFTLSFVPIFFVLENS